jgi:hypothetical protein
MNSYTSDGDFRKMNFHPKKIESSGAVLDGFRKNSMGGQMPVIKGPRKKTASSTSVVEGTKQRKQTEEEDQELEAFMDRMGSEFKTFIKTQKGSRYMQKYLNKITPDKINFLLERTQYDFKDIMCDPYGNYFVQKLIQCCSSNQRIYILKSVTIPY